MEFDELGRELPDQRPVEWPANIKRPLSLQEEIQRFVRVEMAQRAADYGFETFEEADDFNVEDEEDFVSPYEMTELQEDAAMTSAATPPPPSPAEPPLTSDPDVSKSVSNKTNPDKPGSVSSTGVAPGAPPAGGPT